MPQSFEHFKSHFINELWKVNPGWALSVGNHDYDALLEIPSKENVKQKLNVYHSLQDSLKKYFVADLSTNDQTDYFLMKDFLESSDWYINKFKSNEWDPSGYNVGEGFDLVLSNQDKPLEERLTLIGKRLKQVPAYYAAAKENIKHPTLEHTQLAIDQNKGSLYVFDHMLKDSLSKSKMTEAEKQSITVYMKDATEAINDFISYLNMTLKSEKMASTARSFRIGKDLFAEKFHYDIQSKYSAHDIYEIAIEHKKELHEEMIALSKKLWPKYYGNKPMPEGLPLVRQMIDTLSVHHCNRDSFIGAIKNINPELEKFIKIRNLIYIDPSKPLEVRETPAYMAGVAGASINAPGPYEKNRQTYYNVTPLTGYTPEQAESYLREYNDYMLQILCIHEAIPGHYTQLIYSNQSPSLIKSILGNGAMIEGWAVYTERMMLEEGFGGNQPEMWLMYYKWNLRSTINTILDYSIHSLDMSEQDALNLLIYEGFQQKEEARQKWRRATLSQVQLCSYFTGFTETYALREEMKKKLGNKFNLKEFHEKYLSYGSAPVKYIRELMLSKD